MASTTDAKQNPRLQFLQQINGARCVMLGSPDRTQHLQPMSPQIDDAMIEDAEGGGHAVVYFFSDNTSDLGKAVLAEPGAEVRLTFQDSDYQVSALGTLDDATSPELVERFWNVHAAAWYPEDQQDPKLMVLRFTLTGAQVWASTSNPAKYLYEVTKANLTDTLPDVGTSEAVAG